MISLFFSMLAYAAVGCSPSAREIMAWGAKAKTGVVFESARGIRTSNMDPAELEQARGGNMCLDEAMKLASDRPWLRDPALQETWKYFICERVSGLAFVPNVHHRNGATAHVRVSLSGEERYREISIGGRAEQGNCREIFLKQIRENSQAVMQAMLARPKMAPVPAREVIREGMGASAALQVSGRNSGAVEESSRARKSAGADAPAAAPAPAPGARGAE